MLEFICFQMSRLDAHINVRDRAGALYNRQAVRSAVYLMVNMARFGPLRLGLVFRKSTAQHMVVSTGAGRVEVGLLTPEAPANRIRGKIVRKIL